MDGNTQHLPSDTPSNPTSCNALHGRITAACMADRLRLWDCGKAARQGESGNVTTNGPEPGSLRIRRLRGDRILPTLMGVLRLPGLQPIRSQSIPVLKGD